MVEHPLQKGLAGNFRQNIRCNSYVVEVLHMAGLTVGDNMLRYVNICIAMTIRMFSMLLIKYERIRLKVGKNT